MGSLEIVSSNDDGSDGELRYSPGVIQLLSNAFSSGNSSPFLSAFSLSSFAAFAVRNRLLRCWFIFARGGIAARIVGGGTGMSLCGSSVRTRNKMNIYIYIIVKKGET